MGMVVNLQGLFLSQKLPGLESLATIADNSLQTNFTRLGPAASVGTKVHLDYDRLQRLADETIQGLPRLFGDVATWSKKGNRLKSHTIDSTTYGTFPRRDSHIHFYFPTDSRRDGQVGCVGRIKHIDVYGYKMAGKIILESEVLFTVEVYGDVETDPFASFPLAFMKLCKKSVAGTLVVRPSEVISKVALVPWNRSEELQVAVSLEE